MASGPPPHQVISGTSATNNAQAFAGTVHGDVYFGADGARQPSVPPKPHSTVPFRPDSDFIERSDVLAHIERLCALPGGRAALVGLGGTGKSQLAIEYAHRVQARPVKTWVFWVHASNAARFEQGFREIAETTKIAGRDSPHADIYRLVHDWLRGHDGKWLMILDNVDDASYLVDTQAVSQPQPGHAGTKVGRPLREYLPQSQNGSILITSRNREAARRLVEASELVSVEPMSQADAVKLLNKKLDVRVSRNERDCTDLVATLECMPLAIVQAAAYISQLESRYSVRQYIADFSENDESKSSLLNHEDGQLRRDGEAKNSIIITWQLSFDHVREARQSAADLLSLMSFFDSQGIPDSLLRHRIPASGDRAHEEERMDDLNDEFKNYKLTDDELNGDVQILRDFSFISPTEDPSVFQMHKLVQLATRRWLKASQQVEIWQQQFIRNLYMEFPPGYFENWPICSPIFPHVQCAVTQQPRERFSALERASVLHNGAGFAYERGEMAAAIEMSMKAVNAQMDILGETHERTLKTIALQGSVYWRLGRLREAEQLQVQVLEAHTRVLGHDHPVTLASTNNLASTCLGQGQWKETEQLLVQVLNTYRNVLGHDHPKTMVSMHNLACLLAATGKLTQAISLMKECVERWTEVLGPDDHRTAESVATLHQWLEDQNSKAGKASKIAKLLERFRKRNVARQT